LIQGKEVKEMKKALKVAMLIGLVAILALTAGVVVASTKDKAELPNYLGSQACLGCHSDKFTNWETSGHAKMLTEVTKPESYPGDITKASVELKAELAKADYVVAGQRFLAKDRTTGEMKYLNVQWDAAQGQYVAYKGGASWNTGCAGCHATGYDKATNTLAEVGIGCEMCHGPGKEHVLGHGDVSKITASTDAQVCGQCHTGGKAANGSSWPVGYRPGMKLGELLNLPVVDPHATVPSSSLHWRQYPLWAASAHANAVTALQSSGHASAACYKCHSADAFVDETLNGQKFDPATHAPFNAITCVTCHDPHNSTEKGQLRMEAQALCTACHTASIDPQVGLKPGTAVHEPMKEMFLGYGAIGIAPTKGAHASVECIECHMADGNHLMKVIMPGELAELDPSGTRPDSCTTCHASSSRESRQAYLDLIHETIGSKLDALNADITTIAAALKANPSALSADLKAKYDAAMTNVSFVTADGSRGMHNFEYAVKIVNAAQKDIAAAKAALGIK
jgi:predicted CXXCH cytochrome family protein